MVGVEYLKKSLFKNKSSLKMYLDFKLTKFYFYDCKRELQNSKILAIKVPIAAPCIPNLNPKCQKINI